MNQSGLEKVLGQIVTTDVQRYRDITAGLHHNGSMDLDDVRKRQKDIDDEISRILQGVFWEIVRTEYEMAKKHRPILASYILPARVKGGAVKGLSEEERRRLWPTEVMERCGVDIQDVRIYVQKLFTEFLDWVDNAIAGNADRLITPDDERLFRLKFLYHPKIESKRDVEDFLKGFVLMAYADSRYRLDVRDSRDLNGDKLKLGLGALLPVDKERMNEYGITFEQLRTGTKGRRKLGSLIRDGVIATDESIANTPRVVNSYVKVIDEPGLSDEATFYYILRRHGLMAFYGAVIADTMDTFRDKVYTPFYGNMPIEFAGYVERRWEEKTGRRLVSHDEVYNVIYMGCKENHPRFAVSTSHSRLSKFREVDSGGATNILRCLARGEHDDLRINPAFTLGRLRRTIDERMRLYRRVA